MLINKAKNLNLYNIRRYLSCIYLVPGKHDGGGRLGWSHWDKALFSRSLEHLFSLSEKQCAQSTERCHPAVLVELEATIALGEPLLGKQITNL